MEELVVEKIEECGLFQLKNNNGETISLGMEFYGADVKVGDKIFISKRYLDKNWKGYCQPYAFSAEPKDLISGDCENDEEYILLSPLGQVKKIMLKRIYG